MEQCKLFQTSSGEDIWEVVKREIFQRYFTPFACFEYGTFVVDT